MVNLEATVTFTVYQKEYSRKGQNSGFPNFVVAFQYLKETYKKDRDKLLCRAYYGRRRGHGFKLKEGRFT